MSWVDGNWVDEIWSSATWVSTALDATGTYAHFAFQMSNGVTVQPADLNGNPWTTTPQFGMPAVLVSGSLWQFNAADTAAAYDYYSGGSDGSYLWITASFYGGYDPQLGSFSGNNSQGFLRDNSASTVRLAPRNGDGSFLSFGLPTYGPPVIWSNGLTFRFLTADLINEVDVYLEETTGCIFVQSGGVSGMAEGTYAGGIFQSTPPATFAANGDGSPLPAGSLPQWGPPAIYVTNAMWRYRGSAGTADYYGGDRPGQVLSIGSNGAVSYSDRSLNFANVSGLYTGGPFQNLPVIIRSVTVSGLPWPASLYNPSHPGAITVGGQPWYYSSSMTNSSGYSTYLGPQSGQILTIYGSTAVISDPTTGTFLSGTYANETFTFAGSAVSVKKANADGSPADTGGASIPTDIAGDLDVSGNHLTLGSWPNGLNALNALNALTLSYSPPTETGTPTGLLKFDAIPPLTDWIWSNGPGSVERMRITSGGNVGIGTAMPGAKLHVVGDAKIDGVLRTDRAAGDISMGGFTHPAP